MLLCSISVISYHSTRFVSRLIDKSVISNVLQIKTHTFKFLATIFGRSSEVRGKQIFDSIFLLSNVSIVLRTFKYINLLNITMIFCQ